MQKEALMGKIGCADPLWPTSTAIKTNWHKEPPGYLLLYCLQTWACIKMQNAWNSESKMTFLNEKHHVLEKKKMSCRIWNIRQVKRNWESYCAWGDFSTPKWTLDATASTLLRTRYESPSINNRNSVPSNIHIVLQRFLKRECGFYV